MAKAPAAAIREALLSGEVETAHALYEMHQETLDPWPRLALGFRVASAERAYSRAAEVARLAVSEFPGKPESHVFLVSAVFNQGQARRALTIARTALEAFPEHVQLLQLAAQASTEDGRSQDAIGFHERLLALGHEPANQHIRIGRIHLKLYQADQALARFEQAIAAGANRTSLAGSMAIAAERAGKVDLARTLWAETPRDDRHVRRSDEAHKRLDRQVRRTGATAGEEIEPDALPGLQARMRAVTTRGDIRVWRRPRSRTLVLVFGGLQTMMGAAPPAAPGLYVEGSGANLMAFRDANRLLMLDGAASLAPDHDGTIRKLRGLIEAWGIERVYCLGYSVGGLAALRYAVDLGARRLVLMSGVLAMPPGTAPSLLSDLIARGGRRYFDARAYLEERGRGLEVIAVYGEDSPGDHWQARRIEGLPGVRLRPLEGVSAHALGLAPQHDEVICALLADDPDAVRAKA